MSEQTLENENLIPVNELPKPLTISELEQQLFLLQRPVENKIEVQPTITVIGSSRKIGSSGDAATFKSNTNLGWQIPSVASRTDPYVGLARNGNGTTDPLVSFPADLGFTGEGVDLICLDGGDSFAIPGHPEWISEKYGTTRYVEQDWSNSGINFLAITGTMSGGLTATNRAYSIVYFPASISSQFISGNTNPWELSNRKITINTGPGAGQSRKLTTVYQFADSSYYSFVPSWDLVTSGTATGGGSNTITLAVGASAVNDFYVNNWITIDSGTGANQGKRITAYNGSTRVATVDSNWSTTPVSGSSVYTITNTPTNTSTFTIEPFSQPANYYGDYIRGTHGTGTLALAGGRRYGFAKEATLRTLGSHGPSRLCGGNNGAFSFSGSTITTTNASIRTRLSYLAAGDWIIIAGATTTGNNVEAEVLSNTDNGTTRTVTVKNYTFTSEAAVSGTTISHNRFLWGYAQAVELVRLFHINKTDKTRPTVFVGNLGLSALYGNISLISTVYVNNTYQSVDLTTAGGRTAASDNYFLPFRSTSNRNLYLDADEMRDVFNRATDAGVIIVSPAGNEDQRIVDSNHSAYNDYTCIPGDTVSTSGTAQAGTNNPAPSITLATGASSTNDAYNETYIKITSGTGVGQNRVIIDYDGTSKVATVATPWSTPPDNTSVYSVVNMTKAYHNRGLQSRAPKVIVTGAVSSLYTSNKEYRPSYSSSGPRVDVWAPADYTMTATFDVTAGPLWNGTDSNSSSWVPHPDNASFRSDHFSGTSASTPVTGGVVACMAQARPWMDPGAARAAVQDAGTKNRLFTPTPDVFSDQKSLGGSVNNFLYFPYTHNSDT